MTAQTDATLELLAELDSRLADVLTETLRSDECTSMTDASFLAFARVTEALGRRIDAARLIVASEVDERCRPERGEARLSVRMGSASPAELLTRLTGISHTTAKSRLRAARPIASSTSLTGERVPPAFPLLRAAMDAGSVGLDTVAAISTTLGPIARRCHPAELAAAEEELVAAAAGAAAAPALGADETLVQARVWSLVLDPDGVLPEYERASRRRSLRLGRAREGLIPITGDLRPDVAAQLQRLIDAHLSPCVEDRTLPSTGPVFVPSPDDSEMIPHDPRTHTQKQHDVLASILGVAARAAESPTIGGTSPALLVTIAASDLERPDGVALIEGTDQPLPAFVARHIACCGGIQRLVFDDSGRVIELGSRQRVFTGHQRRAITARDGGCVIPGCCIPAAWCEVHHDTEHARGGPTHIDNGVLLCWHHHRTLETSGWSVRMVDGIPQVRAPAYIDPEQRWRPARGSTVLQRDRLRRRVRAG